MAVSRREILLAGAVGITAAGAGVLVWSLARPSNEAVSELLQLEFRDLDERKHTLTVWNGRIRVCNFWAPWCAPCREEIPLLNAAHRRFQANGVEVVGIAIDTVTNVSQFAAKVPLDYHNLIANAETLDVMRRLGNPAGGLPYTLTLDRRGEVAHRKLGAFKADELDQLLSGLSRQ